MLTDDQLAARIGPRLRAELAGLPIPDMPMMLRRRRARRARVTAALTILPVIAVAAATATAFLPGSAAPATQDTAYVVSHVTQALSSVPAGTIMFSRTTAFSKDPDSSVEYQWVSGSRTRTERFTRAGQLTFEFGSVTRGKTGSAIGIDYLSKTWWRFTESGGSSPACSRGTIMLGGTAAQMVASIRAWLSCGTLRADGTATVDGVTTTRLIEVIGGHTTKTMIVPKVTITYFVDPATYLPIRLSVGATSQWDFQWLPPTAANRAKLDFPVPPPGFTQVSG